MKQTCTKFFFCLAILGFILVEFSTSSCSQNTNCTAVVSVTDTLGRPVSQATVKLYANIPGAAVTSTTLTDGSGKTSVTFKNPAIFDITATQGTKTGTGIIQLNIGETTNTTVIIK
ncbi:MAG: hypothetical protein ABI199_08110 [Bacteroidia bacterium]